VQVQAARTTTDLGVTSKEWLCSAQSVRLTNETGRASVANRLRTIVGQLRFVKVAAGKVS
jgi:hypothetical protein